MMSCYGVGADFALYSCSFGRTLLLYALYEILSYSFLQIFNLAASFTTFASLHIIPSPRHPVHKIQMHHLGSNL